MWTDSPILPGWYWLLPRGGEVQIVRVVRDETGERKYLTAGTDEALDIAGAGIWHGPLIAPAMPAG